MTKQIFKVVTLGILGGLALFAIPFSLLKTIDSLRYKVVPKDDRHLTTGFIFLNQSQ